jgi:hypothetical protein
MASPTASPANKFRALDGTQDILQLADQSENVLGGFDVTGAPFGTAARQPSQSEVLTVLGAPLSVTGVRAGNTALASLLTQLAALGLITDNTTAA